jgi:hypothetical protein
MQDKMKHKLSSVFAVVTIQINNDNSKDIKNTPWSGRSEMEKRRIIFHLESKGPN